MVDYYTSETGGGGCAAGGGGCGGGGLFRSMARSSFRSSKSRCTPYIFIRCSFCNFRNNLSSSSAVIKEKLLNRFASKMVTGNETNSIQTSVRLTYFGYPKYLDRYASANSADPDQMPHSVASDQGLHCLPLI